jgi:hypothetical protein
MQAIVSGQAGVALLIHGESLSSIHTGRTDEVVRRRQRDVPYLFGDASDLQLIEDVDLPGVVQRLDLATAKADALQLALILLDDELSHDTRRDAADELRDLMQADGVTEWVERVLYARPLPKEADLSGGLSCCPGNAGSVRDLLVRLRSRQREIRDVYFAWEQIPTSLFGAEQDRQLALSTAVREGLFRELALHRAARVNSGAFQSVRNHREILQRWVSALRKEKEPAPAAPLIPPNRALFVREGGDPVEPEPGPKPVRPKRRRTKDPS